MVAFELGGRDKSELAVQAPVVEPVDVFGDRDLDVADVFQPPFGRMTGLRMHSVLNSELSASAIACRKNRPAIRPTRRPLLPRVARCSESLEPGSTGGSNTALGKQL